MAVNAPTAPQTHSEQLGTYVLLDSNRECTEEPFYSITAPRNFAGSALPLHTGCVRWQKGLFPHHF